MGRITGPWRCFHCGEISREHFGGVAACQLKSSDRHLIEVIREQEERLAVYRIEDTNLMRAIHAKDAEHLEALRRAEEKGFARGVADMKAQGLCPEPQVHHDAPFSRTEREAR